MDIYIVERELPGITREQLAGAQGAAISTSQQFTVQGTPVRHIRSTLVPDESDVNTAAKLPFARIVRALDLTPAMLLIFTGFVFASACGRSPVAPSQRAGLAAATTIASSSAAMSGEADMPASAACLADRRGAPVSTAHAASAATHQDRSFILKSPLKSAYRAQRAPARDATCSPSQPSFQPSRRAIAHFAAPVGVVTQWR